MSAKASSKPDKEPAILSAYVPTTEEEAALEAETRFCTSDE